MKAWQRPSLFIVNFEQVTKSFLVWNIYFTFLYHLVQKLGCLYFLHKSNER